MHGHMKLKFNSQYLSFIYLPDILLKFVSTILLLRVL
jgi:hypothetical protein